MVIFDDRYATTSIKIPIIVNYLNFRLQEIDEIEKSLHENEHKENGKGDKDL